MLGEHLEASTTTVADSTAIADVVVGERRRSRDASTVEAVLELLCELFPKAFVRYQARRRPLKIGIHNDLLAVLDGAVTAAELSHALRIYVSNRVYRERLREGAIRIDLNGEPAGTVAPEHAITAAPVPAKHRRAAAPRI
jgi:ProP effector